MKAERKERPAAGSNLPGSSDPARPGHRPGHRRAELRLPAFDEGRLPGARVVQRAVTVTLGGIVLLAGVLTTALAFITLEVTVDAVGTLEPARVWAVRAASVGTISAVLVTAGDTVRSGQALARLDTVAASAAVAGLEAQLDAQAAERERLTEAAPIDRRQAESSLAQAEARVLRARAALRQRMADFGLFGDVDSVLATYRQGTHVALDGAVSDVLQARADVGVAQAQLARGTLTMLDAEKQRSEERGLRAQLAMGRVTRARTVLTAPAPGVVVTEQLERLPGAAVREGDVVFEVADLTAWRATVGVRERDVHRVRVGDRAEVDIPALAALRDEPLRARVVTVAIEPTGVGESGGVAGGMGRGIGPAAVGAGAYRVELALDRAQVDSLGLGVVRRGYTVQAKIITRRTRAYALAREWLHDHVRGRA